MFELKYLCLGSLKVVEIHLGGRNWQVVVKNILFDTSNMHLKLAYLRWFQNYKNFHFLDFLIC